MHAHIRALLIKFLITLAVAGALLLFTRISLTGALLISIILTLVTYLGADIPFLPVLGRELTVLIDAVLAIPLVRGLTWLYTGTYPSYAVLAGIAITVAIGELFFHTYAMKSDIYRTVRKRMKN